MHLEALPYKDFSALDSVENLPTKTLFTEVWKRVAKHAYLADKLHSLEVDWASKNYGVWLYNQCLQGELVGIDTQTNEFVFRKNMHVGTPRFPPDMFGLTQKQQMVCEWFEQNSVTAMKRRQSGADKQAVSREFKSYLYTAGSFRDIRGLSDSVADLIVNAAYEIPESPSSFKTHYRNDFGVYMYNKCVEGSVFKWR
jgi:hypothetical protein